MRVSAFDFELPEARIALRPEKNRAEARLLVVRPGAVPELEDRRVADLPALLQAGDCLVVNDTKVVPARLIGLRRRAGGGVARIQATLIERLAADRWRTFARPAKRLALGDHVQFAGDAPGVLLDAVVLRNEDGQVDFAFDLAGDALDRAIERIGSMPLPPYIAARRPVDAQDRADYQTMFAREAGAVAAPTAGLHFTPDLLHRIEMAGIGVEHVTLHVGPGTFLPVKADDTSNHVMHSEWARLDADTASRLVECRARGGRIVAVGTTALRVLESASASGTLEAFEGQTAIFITPGYRFRAVDALLTNFHLPRSTLVMLVAAFVGHDTQKRAYAHAIEREYRFYSYGDASLLFRG